MSLNDDGGECLHRAITQIKTGTPPVDQLSTPYICMKCGKAFMIYPLDLKDSPDIEAVLKKAAQQTTNNIKTLRVSKK